MNPNNPQQNPNSFSENVTPAQASPFQTEIKLGVQNGQDALGTYHVFSSNREYEDDVKINVPMFGHWETGDDVSYKAIFDWARYYKNGVKMNPNNPQRNAISFSDNFSPVQVNTFQFPEGNEIMGAQWESGSKEKACVQQQSQDDGDLRRPDDSPWYHRSVNLKVAVESLLNRPGRKRTRRHNVRSDSRVNRSPLSPWEGRGSTESGTNLASLTPARSQQRSITRGAETPGHIAAVPKFGDWDNYIPATADRYTQIFNKVREERLNRTGNVSASALGKPRYAVPKFGDWNDYIPATADGYTQIFNKVREERLNRTGNVSASALGKPYYEDLKQHKNGTFKKCCCFPISW